jgi:hypothetical protein
MEEKFQIPDVPEFSGEQVIMQIPGLSWPLHTMHAADTAVC